MIRYGHRAATWSRRRARVASSRLSWFPVPRRAVPLTCMAGGSLLAARGRGPRTSGGDVTRSGPVPRRPSTGAQALLLPPRPRCTPSPPAHPGQPAARGRPPRAPRDGEAALAQLLGPPLPSPSCRAATNSCKRGHTEGPAEEQRSPSRRRAPHCLPPLGQRPNCFSWLCGP